MYICCNIPCSCSTFPVQRPVFNEIQDYSKADHMATRNKNIAFLKNSLLNSQFVLLDKSGSYLGTNIMSLGILFVPTLYTRSDGCYYWYKRNVWYMGKKIQQLSQGPKKCLQ